MDDGRLPMTKAHMAYGQVSKKWSHQTAAMNNMQNLVMNL